jgi:hypothetical protein
MFQTTNQKLNVKKNGMPNSPWKKWKKNDIDVRQDDMGPCERARVENCTTKKL